MQPLKNHENPIQMLGLDPDAVILDGKNPFLLVFHCGDMNLRRLIPPKFNRILDQVLKYLQ